MIDDKQLMKKTARGDRQAYGELVERYQRLAWHIAYRLVKNMEDAEEIAQEAFLKIFRNAKNYRPTAKFNTYLTRVVTRLCYDHWKKHRPLSYDPQEQNFVQNDQLTAVEGLEKQEVKSTVREAIDQLPHREKVAIILQHYEDFSYREIAQTLEITEKAVERVLARGRNRLKEKLIKLMD